MKWTAPLLPAACVAMLTISCSESSLTSPQTNESPGRPVAFGSGTVTVYVFWDGEGLAGKSVEIVELKLAATTNEAGLATFSVPAGSYTVRVYEINHGGPPLLYVDTEISIETNEEVRVEVFDCLDCV